MEKVYTEFEVPFKIIHDEEKSATICLIKSSILEHEYDYMLSKPADDEHPHWTATKMRKWKLYFNIPAISKERILVAMFDTPADTDSLTCKITNCGVCAERIVDGKHIVYKKYKIYADEFEEDDSNA